MLIEVKLWPCFLHNVCFSTPLLWLIILLLPTLMLNAKIHQHVANSILIVTTAKGEMMTFWCQIQRE